MTSVPAVLLAVTLGAAPSSGTCTGSLLDGTGRPWADMPMLVVNAITNQKYDTRTDASGRFSLSALPAGDYRIEVSRPGFREVAARFILAEGQQLQRDVVPQVAGIVHMYPVPVSPDPARPSRRTVVRITPPEDPCKGATSPGCVTPPMRMVEAWPVYPRTHAAKGTTARIEVTGRLGTDGFLNDLRANDGADPEFAAAAIDALRQWEYSPVRLNGVPQEIPFAVTFRFTTGTTEQCAVGSVGRSRVARVVQ